MEEYAAYSVSVAALEILFASTISMVYQENSWQRVGSRYYLRSLEIKWIYGSRRLDLPIERDKSIALPW